MKLLDRVRGYSQVKGIIWDLGGERLKVKFRTYKDGSKTIVYNGTEYKTDDFEYPTCSRFLGTAAEPNKKD